MKCQEKPRKKAPVERIYKCLSSWSQQGMILRPPDYESGATNQLSYETIVSVGDTNLCLSIIIYYWREASCMYQGTYP